MTDKKINYDQRAVIQDRVLDLIEREFLRHDIIVSQDDLSDIMEFTDDVFEKYTNGQYEKYNF